MANDDRLDFEFVGTTSTKLSLDPTEFAGKSINETADEIMKTLKSIAPNVSFFEDDVVLAAEQLSKPDVEIGG